MQRIDQIMFIQIDESKMKTKAKKYEDKPNNFPTILSAFFLFNVLLLVLERNELFIYFFKINFNFMVLS